jgi:catechol-2,3-dioxygenase
MDNAGAAAPAIGIGTIVLDCLDIQALSDFYIRLLGWQRDSVVEDNWISIRPASGGIRLGFQTNPDYEPPVWPEEPGRQQQMLHIDFAVQSREELARAAGHAVSCGATIAQVQYSDEWVVLLDPAGHPFCFVVSGS